MCRVETLLLFQNVESNCHTDRRAEYTEKELTSIVSLAGWFLSIRRSALSCTDLITSSFSSSSLIRSCIKTLSWVSLASSRGKGPVTPSSHTISYPVSQRWIWSQSFRQQYTNPFTEMIVLLNECSCNAAKPSQTKRSVWTSPCYYVCMEDFTD